MTDTPDRRYSSQFGQDRFVESALGGLRDGVFLDLGAFDGIRFSNTWYLERQLGWTGVAVEPAPLAYAELARNRSCKTLHAAVAPTSGSRPFLEIEGYSAMLSGLEEAYHPEHRARIESERTRFPNRLRTFDVECLSPRELLDRCGLSRIDFLSLDTEGGEYEILAEFPLAEVPVRLLSVENNYNDRRIERLLGSFGFRQAARLGCDDVYSRN